MTVTATQKTVHLGNKTKKTDDVISEGYRLVLDKTNCPAAYCKVRVEGNISELTSAMGQA